MSTVTSGQSERTVAGWDRVSALLLHTERLLQLVENDDPATCDRSVDLELIRQLCGSVAEMREALVDREGQLARVTERSEALARAQADAIVHSAEIIDELERTKQSLSDARAAAEQAAQDTQRLADTVFEQTHDGVLVFHNHTCVACNDNSLDLLNSTRDDVIGRWPVSFTRAKLDTGASAETLLRQICTPGYAEEARSLEVRLQPVETHEFWAEVTATEFRMKDVGHVLLVVRDITARKKFEVELRRHRDFLNNIINAVPDPLSVKAVDRTLVVANDAFCNVLGVTRDEVLGQNADQLLPQHLASHIHSIEDRLLSTGDCSMAEHEIPRADGTTSIVSTKRSVFQDESSGERFIVATSRDITDDRLREDRLRLLASVFNSSTEGVAILSSEGTIREANPAFLSMSWNAEGTVLGRAISEALRFDDRELATALKQVEAGTSWSGKATATDKNRVTRSYWVSLSPSADLEEVSGRIIALVSDITELEATQAKLRRQAMYDNLTGLPNRRFFREHLQRLIEHSPSSSGVTICFLDLDDFKHVNDSAGHSTGDTLLQSVGRRIERVVGPDAFVARFGGDE
ncbi:MAG: PAS domain S-box protein, partial [Planctomycetales bacterium]|nr:PAS domain S-box protein [Planctomycetales bacterium]